jgi:hypothetical protein
MGGHFVFCFCSEETPFCRVNFLFCPLLSDQLHQVVSRRNHVFDSRSVRVGSAVNEVALGGVSVGVLEGFPVSIIPI